MHFIFILYWNQESRTYYLIHNNKNFIIQIFFCIIRSFKAPLTRYRYFSRGSSSSHVVLSSVLSFSHGEFSFILFCLFSLFSFFVLFYIIFTAVSVLSDIIFWFHISFPSWILSLMQFILFYTGIRTRKIYLALLFVVTFDDRLYQELWRR